VFEYGGEVGVLGVDDGGVAGLVVVLGMPFVPVVPGIPFGDRGVPEFPFMLPGVPGAGGFVVSGKVPGVVGVAGDTGLFGEVGLTGDVGLVGLVGEFGLVGVPGMVGVLGEVVLPGDVGLVGVCGAVCALATPAKAQTTKMAAS
jgi:integrin beta 8